MAKDKKSFILYADLIDRVEHLTNEEKGILFQHLLEYVNDKNPILSDRIIIGVWKPIEQQLKRDLNKFKEVKQKRSEAGKRSAELRALKSAKQTSTNSTSVESVQQTSTNSTVNVNDNVNVNVINKDICSTTKVEPINFDILLNYINEKTNRSFKKVNDAVRKKYNARLKEGYTKKDIQTAIDNAVKSEYHKEKGFKYLTPEFFSRADKIDLFSQTNETAYVSPEQQYANNVKAEIERLKNLKK